MVDMSVTPIVFRYLEHVATRLVQKASMSSNGVPRLTRD